MTYCHVKYTGCVTVWRIVMLHWLWYRMAHWQAKGTGRGTVWHIVMWKALVMVPYDTLPGERYWSWYRKTHCQMKGTGRGTIWHITRCEALVVVPYDTLTGGRHWSWYVWHILTHDHVGNEYKISTNSETMIKVFDNIYAFVSNGNARLLTSMWLITLLG
jgi:hypothetical protein